MEFSPPRIHSPYYNIDDTCNPYAKDEKLFLETFQKHFKHPQEAGARSKASSSSWGQQEGLCWLLFTSLVMLTSHNHQSSAFS